MSNLEISDDCSNKSEKLEENACFPEEKAILWERAGEKAVVSIIVELPIILPI